MCTSALLAFVLVAVSAAPASALPIDVANIVARDAGLYAREPTPALAARGAVNTPVVGGSGSGKGKPKREDYDFGLFERDATPVLAARGAVNTQVVGGSGKGKPKRSDESGFSVFEQRSWEWLDDLE